mmetsp:Transcript_47209/g.125403  ORF Transcript_47209/g.125403 Transcript_47209/m.125403 type:complete len:221 (-) Transcript_47209:103-765(-)
MTPQCQGGCRSSGPPLSRSNGLSADARHADVVLRYRKPMQPLCKTRQYLRPALSVFSTRRDPVGCLRKMRSADTHPCQPRWSRRNLQCRWQKHDVHHLNPLQRRRRRPVHERVLWVRGLRRTRMRFRFRVAFQATAVSKVHCQWSAAGDVHRVERRENRNKAVRQPGNPQEAQRPGNHRKHRRNASPRVTRPVSNRRGSPDLRRVVPRCVHRMLSERAGL